MTTKNERRSELPGTWGARQGFGLMGRKDRFCLENTTVYYYFFLFLYLLNCLWTSFGEKGKSLSSLVPIIFHYHTPSILTTTRVHMFTLHDCKALHDNSCPLQRKRGSIVVQVSELSLHLVFSHKSHALMISSKLKKHYIQEETRHKRG